jgi:hypothetical protein
MFAPFEGWFSVEFFPYHKLVVVAARCELSVFLVPLQTANLLLMAHKFAKPLLRLPDIPVVDDTIP